MQSQTFVFFGIVGSGKGTQVKLLMDFLKNKNTKECVYIGTGDIFREIVGSSKDDSETQTVKEIINSGRLMPDEITNKLVFEAVKLKSSPDKHLIFDGYPRTTPQSKYFANLVKERTDIKIIFIELNKEEAMKRNLLRGRHDDTREGLTKRFNEYVNNVIPAMNYFKGKAGYQIYTINGEQT